MIKKSKRDQIKTVRFRHNDYKAIELAAYNSHRTASSWIECACLWALKNNAVDIVPSPKANK